MQYDIKKIALRLVSERKTHKFSQEKLAGILKVNRNTLSSWETAWGESSPLPPLKHLLKLCDLYNCELDYLLCEIDCKTRSATDICKATGLSPEALTVLSDGDGVAAIDLEFKNSITIAEFINELLTYSGFLELFYSYCNYRRFADAPEGTSLSRDLFDELIKQSDNFGNLFSGLSMWIEDELVKTSSEEKAIALFSAQNEFIKFCESRNAQKISKRADSSPNK